MALAACLPFYFGQKRSLTVATWVNPPKVGSVLAFIDEIFVQYLFLIPACGLFASILWARRARSAGPEPDESGVGELAGLAGLVGLPVVLMLFSVGVQSVLVGRYAIAAVASISVLAAPLLARTLAPLRWAVLVVLLLASSAELVLSTRSAHLKEAARAGMAEELSKLPDAPILIESRAMLDDLWWDAPGLRGRLFLWSPSDRGVRTADWLLLERDMASNHEAWYGLPASASLDLVHDRPNCYVYGVKPADLLYFAHEKPDLAFRTIESVPDLYEVTRKPRPVIAAQGDAAAASSGSAGAFPEGRRSWIEPSRATSGQSDPDQDHDQDRPDPAADHRRHRPEQPRPSSPTRTRPARSTTR